MFAGFEICYTALAVILLALWRFFCIDRRYICQDTHKNECSPTLKPVLQHSLFILHFVGFIALIESTVAKYKQKRVFAGFGTGFMAFAILFLTLGRYFCIHQRYRCKITGENVCLLALKLVLRHSSFFF